MSTQVVFTLTNQFHHLVQCDFPSATPRCLQKLILFLSGEANFTVTNVNKKFIELFHLNRSIATSVGR